MDLPDPRTKIPQKPTLGRVVIFRSRTGSYDVPAMITATTETLAPAGVGAFVDSGGQRGVPPLTGVDRVHLTVFTPGLPGQRAEAGDFLNEPVIRSENLAGCYQEWDVPLDGSEDRPVEVVGEPSPGTWRWPVVR